MPSDEWHALQPCTARRLGAHEGARSHTLLWSTTLAYGVLASIAKLGCGLPAFGGGFTGTPNIGFGMSEGARDYRLGWRLTAVRREALDFELNLDATRSESANDDAGPEHGVMLRAGLRW